MDERWDELMTVPLSQRNTFSSSSGTFSCERVEQAGGKMDISRDERRYAAIPIRYKEVLEALSGVFFRKWMGGNVSLTEYPLPEGAKFIQSYESPAWGGVVLVFEHESFEPVEWGCEIPYLSQPYSIRKMFSKSCDTCRYFAENTSPDHAICLLLSGETDDKDMLTGVTTGEFWVDADFCCLHWDGWELGANDDTG